MGQRHAVRRLMVAAMLLAGATGHAVAQDGEPEIIVVAGMLRQVKITYTERGFQLGRCDVKLGKDARIVDQMMCSLLANCLASGWTGTERATKCMNRRVDEVEAAAAEGKVTDGSPFPDEWLASGYQRTRQDAVDGVALTGAGPVEPGNWVFTEMMVGRSDKGMTRPYLLRWRTCIATGEAGSGLARLLEPPPYTANLRMTMPPDCQRWDVKAARGGLTGSMGCRTPGSASTSGRLQGRFDRDTVVLRRDRRWQRPGGWAEATFDTRAVRQGSCAA